jgi:hypothetical protein
MVALAASALADLVWAFTPLVSVWAVHEAARRGGEQPGVIMWMAQVAGGVLVLLSQFVAAVCLAVWTYRSASNAHALGRSRWPAWLAWLVWFVPVVNAVAPPIVVAGVAVSRDARRPVRLRWPVWLWWPLWLAGAVALGLGSALTWPPELRQILAAVAAGETVALDRAGQLLGYQIAGRLPGGVLLVAAAALGILAVHRITMAQYDLFDELRSGGAPAATPADPTTAGPTAPAGPADATAPAGPADATAPAGPADATAPVSPVATVRTQLGAADALDARTDRAPAP